MLCLCQVFRCVYDILLGLEEAIDLMTPLGDGPPFGPVVNGTMVVFWEYRPSNVAAYLFLSLFALATLGHLIYFVWLRSWTFIPLLLGGICELLLLSPYPPQPS